MSISVLLADDHEVVRSGLRALLEKQADVEIVAEAPDGRTAVALSHELSPDVVVMDITMPGMNGIDATRQIVKNHPHIRVLALSVHVDRSYVEAMLDAGASGYVTKNCASDELVDAVLSISRGIEYISPRVPDVKPPDSGDRSSPVGGNISRISAREREIVQLVAEGHATKVIARNLHISIRTVDTHRRNILKKLDIDNVADLTRYAIREGLTPLDS